MDVAQAGARTLLLCAFAFTACQNKTIEAYPDKFVGIGVVVKAEDSTHVVQKVIAGSPAEEAGLEPGAKLLAVDGQPTNGQTLASIVAQLRGTAGSQVELRLQDANGSIMTAIVTRRTLARNDAQGYEAP